MKKYLRRSAIMMICAGLFAVPALTAEEQNPTPAPPNTQPGTTPTFQLTAPETLVGCLYKEKDVPGREPNIVEKAGVMEDYILADATIKASGKAPASGKMYKVEKIDDSQLSAHVGKKVEVVGRIDAEPDEVPAPKPDRGVGPDKIDLPEFEAVSIREVPGTCPSKPVK